MDDASRQEDAALWWVDHARAVSELATGIATRDLGKARLAKESFWDLSVRWTELTCHPLAGWLMAEHLSLVSAFADASAARSKRQMDALLSALLANADEQARLHSSDSVRFPAQEFRDGMAKHVARIGSYVEGMMWWDTAALGKAWKQVEASRDDLARIWMKAFSRKPAGADESARASSKPRQRPPRPGPVA